MTTGQKIIEEICREEGISVKHLSKDWVLELEKNGIRRYIAGYKFDLNGHALGEVLDDKYGTYDLLKQAGFPVVPHHILYPHENMEAYALGCHTEEDAIRLFQQYGNDVVLKSNTGTCGYDVYHVKTQADLLTVRNQLLRRNASISLNPYRKILHEYRVILLEGKAWLTYQKNLPVVVGDGIHSLRELLLQKQSSKTLQTYESTEFDTILEVGKTYPCGWKYNLSQGATVTEEIDDKKRTRLLILAEQIASRFDIQFASIDLIETEEFGIEVLEINSGVMMDFYASIGKKQYEMTKKIYREALEKMMGK